MPPIVIRVDRPFGDKTLRSVREACWTLLGAFSKGLSVVRWAGCMRIVRLLALVLVESRLCGKRRVVYVSSLTSFSPISLLSISEAN